MMMRFDANGRFLFGVLREAGSLSSTFFPICDFLGSNIHGFLKGHGLHTMGVSRHGVLGGNCS